MKSLLYFALHNMPKDRFYILFEIANQNKTPLCSCHYFDNIISSSDSPSYNNWLPIVNAQDQRDNIFVPLKPHRPNLVF